MILSAIVLALYGTYHVQLKYANIAWELTFSLTNDEPPRYYLNSIINLILSVFTIKLKLPCLYVLLEKTDTLAIFFIPQEITTTSYLNPIATHCLVITNFFSNRVIEDWNHLPNDVAYAKSLNTCI